MRHGPPPPMPGSYLVLETTGSCNLDCVHCDRAQTPPVGIGDEVYGGCFLDLDMARTLMDDLGRVGAHFDTLILFWLGDPLLHPHFETLYPLLVRANEQHGVFGKIELHTNAVGLEPGLARVALNKAHTHQVWHLTVDAVHRHTYRRIKGRDHFAKVEDNIQRLIEDKGLLGSPWPRLVLQFIVSDRNVDEAELFRARWARVLHRAGLRVRASAGHVPSGEGDEAVIFFRQLDCPTPERQSEQNRVFRTAVTAMGLELPGGDTAPAQVEALNPHPCSGFWKSPVVRWNGDVTVCTRDATVEMKVGNLRDAPFSKLWWGPEMASRRLRVARGDYEGLPLCGRCFIPRSANYTGIEPLEIERHQRWADPPEEAP